MLNAGRGDILVEMGGYMRTDWVKKKIREIGKVQTGSTPKTSERGNFGNYVPFIKPSDFFKNGSLEYENQGLSEVGLKQSRLVDKESVLMVCIGATIGKVGFTEKNVTTNQQINSLTPLNGDCAKFLFYQMLTQDFQQKVLSSAGQATLPIINKTKWSNLSLYLPSLLEQKRIVSIVDQAFEGIDGAIAHTKKNLTNARELFESYRNSVLTQEGRQWEETTLGAEIDLMTGFPFKSNRYTESDRSIRLLRGDNIIQGSLRWDDVKKWSESEIDEFLTYQLQEGDVVLAMDRPWVKAGLKHAMISQNDLPCLLVQRTACLRGTKNISNRFLMYLIGSHAFIRHILSNQTGIGVPHISGKQIQSFRFLRPTLSEQNFISNNLDELSSKNQRLEAIYQQKLDALTELKQSILQKAFTGELTADIANQTTKKAEEAIAA